MDFLQLQFLFFKLTLKSFRNIFFWKVILNFQKRIFSNIVFFFKSTYSQFLKFSGEIMQKSIVFFIKSCLVSLHLYFALLLQLQQSSLMFPSHSLVSRHLFMHLLLRAKQKVPVINQNRKEKDRQNSLEWIPWISVSHDWKIIPIHLNRNMNHGQENFLWNIDETKSSKIWIETRENETNKKVIESHKKVKRNSVWDIFQWKSPSMESFLKLSAEFSKMMDWDYHCFKRDMHQISRLIYS